MKSYSEERITGVGFEQLVIPSGDKFPRGATAGEIFRLTVDQPKTNTKLKWYSRGTYVYDGLFWDKLNDAGRIRTSFPIGARQVDIARAADPERPLTTEQGVVVAEAIVKPSHKNATISGTANFWLDVSSSALVWMFVCRGEKVLSVSAQHVKPGEITTMAASFIDIPGSEDNQIYTIRVNMNAKGLLFVNTSNTYAFDGLGQTAFIIGEDTYK